MIGRRSAPLAIAAAVLGVVRARPAEARPAAFIPMPGRRSIPVDRVPWGPVMIRHDGLVVLIRDSEDPRYLAWLAKRRARVAA